MAIHLNIFKWMFGYQLDDEPNLHIRKWFFSTKHCIHLKLVLWDLELFHLTQICSGQYSLDSGKSPIPLPTPHFSKKPPG